MTDVEVRDENGDIFAQWKGSPEPAAGDLILRRDGETAFVASRNIRPAGDGVSASLEVRAHRVDTEQPQDLAALLEETEARATAAELKLERLETGRDRSLEVHRLLEAVTTLQPGAVGFAQQWFAEQKKRDAIEKRL